MHLKLSKKLLRAICRYYVKEYGGLAGELHSWKFNFVETVTIPELNKVVNKYESDENLVPKLFKELAMLGYLSEEDWGYTLTEKGLTEGTQSTFGKVINYLNKNPGFAIIVSFISLAVAVGALFIGYLVYTKP